MKPGFPTEPPQKVLSMFFRQNEKEQTRQET